MECVQSEIKRTRLSAPDQNDSSESDFVLRNLLGDDYKTRFDRFDIVQLIDVIAVCRKSRTLSEAGKTLFSVSRQGKKSINDADRLSKYLARFGLDFYKVAKTN